MFPVRILHITQYPVYSPTPEWDSYQTGQGLKFALITTTPIDYACTHLEVSKFSFIFSHTHKQKKQIKWCTQGANQAYTVGRKCLLLLSQATQTTSPIGKLLVLWTLLPHNFRP